MVPLGLEGVTGTSQVTPNEFQQRVEQRLNAAFDEFGMRVEIRRTGWEEVPFVPARPEAFVYVRVQELEVRIRESSVSFTLSGEGNYAFEMPDYANPDDLADAVVARLRKEWLT